MSKTTAEVLSEMARLTALSGRISDVQAKNLQMYPLVFFDGVTRVQVDYDLIPTKTIADAPSTNNPIVQYFLEIEEDKNSDLNERFTALERAVRTIFWKDVVVELYFNGKIKDKSVKNG